LTKKQTNIGIPQSSSKPKLHCRSCIMLTECGEALRVSKQHISSPVQQALGDAMLSTKLMATDS